MPAVISCFDYTGVMVEPWRDAGYECYCVDVQHAAGITERNGIKFVGADMLNWLPPRTDIAFAAFFPPCTDTAVSGAAHFKKKGLGAIIQALKLFEVSVNIAEMAGAAYLIENPVSTISTYWRKPDYMFNPYEYGGYLSPNEVKHPRYPDYIADADAYPKKTCLWTGGGFVMPEKKPVPCEEGYALQHLKLGGKSERTKNIRSETPRGFARAVFEANK